MAKRPKPSSSAPRAAQAADATVSVAGAVLRVLGTILLIVLVTGLLFLCIFAYYVKNCLSTDLDVQLSDFTVSLSSSILYEDSDGNWQNLTNLSSTENRVWIDYADIPKDMEHAAVAIEDKRFYKHKGVDWYRTTGAFINMFLSMKNDFGGSTITQQLIKNLTKQDDITVQRKLLEIFQALEFEKSYDKEEIMEWYLNIVYFGEGCNGVYTAAETYFGKEPKDLTLAECASIIGITNNPSKYDPFISRENNKARQETILKQMYEQGYINKEQYDEAVAQELVFVRSESDDATTTPRPSSTTCSTTSSSRRASAATRRARCSIPAAIRSIPATIPASSRRSTTSIPTSTRCRSARRPPASSSSPPSSSWTPTPARSRACPAARTKRPSTSARTGPRSPSARPDRPSSRSRPTARPWSSASSRSIRRSTMRRTSSSPARAGIRKTPAAATTASSPSARRCSARSTPCPRRSSTSSPRARRMNF